MKVVRIVASNLGNNTYLLLAEKPALIDPSLYTDTILTALREHEPESLECVILTHCHFDHVHASQRIKEETNAKIAIHKLDANCLNFKPDEKLEDGDTISLGNFFLEVIHTPGHTPGSICLYEPKTKSLFSGDTLFADGIFGRTDLPGGSIEQMISSFKRLCKLDVKILYPGHDDITSNNVNKQIENALRKAQQLIV